MEPCPRCGQPVPSGASTCPSCGHDLVQIRILQGIPYRTILAAIWLTIFSGVLVLLVVKLDKLLFELVVAAFLALVVTPVVAWLQKRGLSRGRSIAILVVSLMIATLGIAAAITAPLVGQVSKFATNAPEYLQQAETGQGTLGRLAAKLHLQDKLRESSPSISKTLSNLSSRLVEFGRRIASAAFEAVIVIILSIFMLVEGPRMIDAALRAMPPPRRDAAQRVGRGVLKVVSGYTTGVLLMALLNGLVALAAMEATRTPFAVPIGIWAGVVDILPIVGGLFAVIPAALFAFANSITAGIIVVAAILIYQQIKNHLLYPVIVGRAVQLNSLLVLVAVLAGAELGHIGGAVLAIPIAGTVQVLSAEVVRVRRAARGRAEDDLVTVSVPGHGHAEPGTPGVVRRFLERFRRSPKG